MKSFFILSLVMLLFCNTVYANDKDEVRFEVTDHIPHRSIVDIGDSAAVIGVYNLVNSILTLQSSVNLNLVNIEVYKNGEYIMEITEFLEAGDIVEINLSGYGAGEYEVVIGRNEEDELSGSFTIE